MLAYKIYLRGKFKFTVSGKDHGTVWQEIQERLGCYLWSCEHNSNGVLRFQQGGALRHDVEAIPLTPAELAEHEAKEQEGSGDDPGNIGSATGRDTTG